MRQHAFREMKQFLIVLKVAQGLFRFCKLRSVIGPQNSRHFLNQSDPKLKPFTTPSPAFSRALVSLLVFTLSCH